MTAIEIEKNIKNIVLPDDMDFFRIIQDKVSELDLNIEKNWKLFNQVNGLELKYMFDSGSFSGSSSNYHIHIDSQLAIDEAEQHPYSY
jgi:hypothetical protein